MSVLDTARSLLGRPYQFGGPMGRSVGDGPCDCSGWMREVFRRNGIDVPAFTDAIASSTSTVSESDRQPGDLVLYRYADAFQPGTQYPHVDLYAGGESAIGCKAPEGSSEHPILGLPHEYHRVPGVVADDQATATSDQPAVAASGLSPWVWAGGLAALLILLNSGRNPRSDLPI